MISDYFIHWRRNRIITQFLAGTLRAPKRRAFELHMLKCRVCREQLEKEKLFDKEILSAHTIFDEAWAKSKVQLQKLPKHTGVKITPKSQPIIRMPRWEVQYWRINPLMVKIAVVVMVLSGIVIYYSKPKLTPVEVVASLGDGVYRQTGNSSLWERVDEKTQLRAGDKIRTDKLARTYMKMGKVGEVWLNQGTEITLFSDKSTALEVTQGEVYVTLSNYHNLFQVKTPAGLVQVYGTQFVISVDTLTNTKVSCIENKVFYENKGTQVIIPAGYRSFALPQSAPSSPVQADLSKVFFWKRQFEELSKLPKSERRRVHNLYVAHGDRLFHNKQYAEALERYQIAVFLDPDDYIPYYGIGRSYKELGEFDLATTTFLMTMARRPNEASIYYQFSMCLMELKQYDATEKVLLQLIAKRPQSHTEWVLLGDVYILDNKPEKAYQAFQQGIKLGADKCVECAPQIHGGLAEIARRKGNLRTAVTEIMKAMEYENIPSIVYAEAGWVYRDQEDFNQEQEAWKNYLKIDPKGSFASQAKMRLAQ